MIPGQKLRSWWQNYALGRLMTPQAITEAAWLENPDPPLADRFLYGPPPDDGWKAPERLMAVQFMASEAHIKQWGRADWQQTDIRLMRWAALFIEYARKRGIPLYVHTAFRTKAEQDKLLADGFSKLRHPLGAHNIGEAVDIVHGVYHWEMSSQEWYMLYTLGLLALERVNATLPKAERLRLNWGGDDRTKSDRFRWDPAHWEISDYRTRTRVLAPSDPVRLTPRAILARVKL